MKFLDELNDICTRVKQLKENSISESVFNEIDVLAEDFEELISDIKGEQQ